MLERERGQSMPPLQMQASLIILTQQQGHKTRVPLLQQGRETRVPLLTP